MNGLIFFILLLFTYAVGAASPAAPDGVTSVGNGGGFAEMEAFAADRGLPTLLEHCLDSANPCQLKDADKPHVTQLLRTLQGQNRELIQINTTCQEPFFHREANGADSIDACALYSKMSSAFGPEPLAHRKIAAQVVRARLLQNGVALDVASHLAETLTSVLHYEDRQVVVPVGGFHFRLHLWKLDSGAQIIPGVTVETLTRSWDVGSELKKSWGCGESNFTYELQDFEFLENDSGTTGKSMVTWTCGASHFRALLYLDLTFAGNDLTGLKISLYQKEHL